MLRLRDLQAYFARALLRPGEIEIAQAIADDGLPASVRLDIYRNTVLVSLTEALADTFPVVCRLVADGFFRYAAVEFIRAHPPEQACLSDYGAAFADFLVTFRPCGELVYLADVARLEWLLHRAAGAEDAMPLSCTALRGIEEAAAQQLVLELDPSLGLLSSPWPVDRIWRTNRCGPDATEPVDLRDGGARLEVRRIADEVVLRSLDGGGFAFRAALQRRATLAAAAEAALVADPSFDLATALAEAFRDGSVVAIAVEDEGP